MQAINPLLKRLVFAIILSALAFGTMLLLSPQPCDKPISVSVGQVDSRFNIPKSSVTNSLVEAATLWNNAIPGTELVKITNGNADVVVSFVYDERQRTTIRNERLKRQIAEQKNELSTLRSSLSTTQEAYDALSADIQQRTSAYLARLAIYKETVSEWNQKGGAPSGVYEDLRQEQLALEVMRISLNNDIDRLNKLGDALKSTSGKHNEIVEDVNQKVDTVNESAMKEFEEGVYDPATKTITIYEFESPIALKRVLAHELGHALEIGHVDGKDSIMYPYNDSSVFELSKTDLAAIRLICKK